MKLLQAHFGSAAFAAAMALMLLAQPAARAFTIDNNSGNNSDGSARYVDPDEQAQNFGLFGSGNSTSSSGSHFFFGTQSPDQARNPWSNPVTRPLSPDSFNQGNGNYRN
jgi:hypothetical protein